MQAMLQRIYCAVGSVARAASAPSGGAAGRGFELCSTHVSHRGFSPIFAGPGHSRGATMGLRRARRLRGSCGFGDLQKDV